MIDIRSWSELFTDALQKAFYNRIYFVGLQGSYARGEATENSDIDVVVILDSLNIEDIKVYDTILDELPHRNLTCGFISGKNELMNWEPSELFQFYYDTTPIIGSLDGLLSIIDREAVLRAVKISAGNLYHGCVHNMLHEKSIPVLRDLYKSAIFTIQAIYFLQSGNYVKKKIELIELTDISEKRILIKAQKIRNNLDVDFDEMSEELFHWCKKLLSSPCN